LLIFVSNGIDNAVFSCADSRKCGELEEERRGDGKDLKSALFTALV
jgi:hypothetical protein